MTIPEFLEKLRKTSRRWHLTYMNKIRFEAYSPNTMDSCPAEKVPGLSDKDFKIIAYAADDFDNHDPKIRQELLQATGLIS